MPEHVGDGVLLKEPVDERSERPLLRSRPRVLRPAVLVQPPYIADADGVLVVRLPRRPGGIAVRSVPRQGTSQLHGAVKVDDVVVADAGEPALLVPLVYVCRPDVLPFTGGAAMDDDGVDMPSFLIISRIFFIMLWISI